MAKANDESLEMFFFFTKGGKERKKMVADRNLSSCYLITLEPFFLLGLQDLLFCRHLASKSSEIEAALPHGIRIQKPVVIYGIPSQGCRMVYFQTKNPHLGKI
jgi:hypothetical protein